MARAREPFVFSIFLLRNAPRLNEPQERKQIPLTGGGGGGGVLLSLWSSLFFLTASLINPLSLQTEKKKEEMFLFHK